MSHLITIKLIARARAKGKHRSECLAKRGLLFSLPRNEVLNSRHQISANPILIKDMKASPSKKMKALSYYPQSNFKIENLVNYFDMLYRNSYIINIDKSIVKLQK